MPGSGAASEPVNPGRGLRSFSSRSRLLEPVYEIRCPSGVQRDVITNALEFAVARSVDDEGLVAAAEEVTEELVSEIASDSSSFTTTGNREASILPRCCQKSLGQAR